MAGTRELKPRMGLEWLHRIPHDPSRAGLIARFGLAFLKDFIFYPRP